MPLSNLTPLQCLAFESLDTEGRAWPVVLVKMTYALDVAGPELQAQGFTHRLRLSQEQPGLEFADLHYDEDSASSVKIESEISPPKPTCDVVLVGEAFAPKGWVRELEVSIQLETPDQPRPLPERPQPLNPFMDLTPQQEADWQREAARCRNHPLKGTMLIHKRLRILGPRWIRKRNMFVRFLWGLIRVGTLNVIRRNPYRLTRPKPITSLPLRYEYAFGGHVQVKAGDASLFRVPKKHWLPGKTPGELSAEFLSGGPQGVLSECFWEPNPIGRGYAPLWYLKAAKIKRLEAPQIESPDFPFKASMFYKVAKGKVKATEDLAPHGYGFTGRAWAPRCLLGGNADESFAKSGKALPDDFKAEVWNGAHPEMQCPHLAGSEILTLTNLCPPDHPGATRDDKGQTRMRFALPGHFPFVLIDLEDGKLATADLPMDTLVIEPVANRVICLHRRALPMALKDCDMELRLVMPGEPRTLQIENEDGQVDFVSIASLLLDEACHV